MSIIKYGDDLSAPTIQPGWKIEEDGFGMLQATATYKWSKAYAGDFPEMFQRGDPFVIEPYTNLKLFKASFVAEKGDIITVTAEYCGLAASGGYDGRGYSDPQIMMTGAASTESIQSHPNFLKQFCTSFGEEGTANVLANRPPPKGGFDESLATNPNRALWTPRVEFTGSVNNCQFVGFLPNQDPDDDTPNIKAGIKSYYKPQNTLRVLIYFNDETNAINRASIVGWVTNGDSFFLPDAYKALAADVSPYSGSFTYIDSWNEKIHKSFLVTNTSVERFGSLWKVTADLVLSGLGGWDKDVYPYSTLG
jgi:hypothetical protein